MKTVVTITIATILAASGAAQAKGAAPGAVLAAPCFNCHGTDGRGAGAIPSIGGKPAEALLQQLAEFKAGTRSATVMTRLAKGYSDEQLAALARFFAEVK